MLDPQAPSLPADDSFAVLSVRDSLGEGEAAAAIIQNWLAQDADAQARRHRRDPASRRRLCRQPCRCLYGGRPCRLHICPAGATRRNIGAEAVLHFVECRRRPAPAMALASLYSSPVLCWPPEVGRRWPRR
jgi:hypothetical protein